LTFDAKVYFKVYFKSTLKYTFENLRAETEKLKNAHPFGRTLSLAHRADIRLERGAL
jgi:hypothetical protein